MKPSKNLIFLALLFPLAVSVLHAQTTVTLNLDSNDVPLYGTDRNTLLADGDMVQFGYYTAATPDNPFAGEWTALTGEGTAIETVINGFSAWGEAYAGQFWYAGLSLTALVPDGQIMAVRFYNAPTVAASTHYGVVSSHLAVWPGDVATHTIIFQVGQEGTVWLGGNVAFTGTAVALIPEFAATVNVFAFATILLVPAVLGFRGGNFRFSLIITLSLRKGPVTNIVINPDIMNTKYTQIVRKNTRGGALLAASLLAVAFVAPAVRSAVTIDGYTSTGTTPTTHDLTSLGALDWAHWGGWEGSKSSPGFDHKTGANLISDYSALNGGATNFSNGFFTLSDPQYAIYSWTDGTTQTTQVNAPYGIVINPIYNTSDPSSPRTYTSGLTFTVQAGLDTRELLIFTGGYNADIQLTATLASGGSASDTWSGGWRNGYYSITFTGTSSSDVLTVTLENLTSAAKSGNLSFQAAALRSTAVPEPTSASLLGALCVGLILPFLLARKRHAAK